VAKESSVTISGEQPDDVWERIRQDLSWQQTDSIRIDKAREGHLRHSNHVPIVASRADNYLYYIVEEVQKRNMPVEIALIPMIESSWDPFAGSYSGAAGLWQIMPATGTHLGLEQDSWYDGRKSVRDSTTVALDYLETLYQQFDQDWFLALAAYNAGAGNIARARKANEAQGLGTDYWSLKLRRQATDYVPKLIALAQIVAEPERFDVELPPLENAPSFEVVETVGHLQMSQAAELAGVDLDTLRALNPGQLRETISPGRPLEMLVPFGSANRFEYNISKLSPEELVQWKTYRIKPGDSLGLIARKFNIEVGILQDINSIEDNKIRAGDVLKIPDGSHGNLGKAVASGEGPPPQGYMVRKGDSLSRIAGKFNVSVDDIIAWNTLDPDDHLKPGQELKLYVKGG
jgi:membrane-bound lytic murein transglycosylase D